MAGTWKKMILDGDPISEERDRYFYIHSDLAGAVDTPWYLMF